MVSPLSLFLLLVSLSLCLFFGSADSECACVSARARVLVAFFLFRSSLLSAGLPTLRSADRWRDTVERGKGEEAIGVRVCVLV